MQILTLLEPNHNHKQQPMQLTMIMLQDPFKPKGMFPSRTQTMQALSLMEATSLPKATSGILWVKQVAFLISLATTQQL